MGLYLEKIYLIVFFCRQVQPFFDVWGLPPQTKSWNPIIQVDATTFSCLNFLVRAVMELKSFQPQPTN